MNINRYRETYNLLTYSKAFKETGQADNSKVNKNQWTPHNVRRVCFDANGILEVRYTTNNKQIKLVDLKGFTQQKHPDLIMKEMMEGKVQREQKGMIDALYSNLVFSNIEEIALFTGGFKVQEDLALELERLNRFMVDITTIKKSFKRLHTILLVEGTLTEGVESSINPNKTLEEQLIESGVKFEKKTVVPLPDRNENGVLSSFILDSGEYRLDKPFNKDNKEEKEALDCRLSKWYEWSKENAKRKALEDKEKAEDKEEEKEESREVKKEYDGQLTNAVKSTLGKLEAFYAPIWNDTFDGIFHEGGLRSVNPDRRYNNNFIISKIYEAWKETAGITGEVNDIDKLTLNLKADYSPGFHRNVLKKKREWANIRKSLQNKYSALYEEHYPHNSVKINELEKKLTNCMIATNWSKNQVFLRFTGVDRKDKDKFVETMDRKLKETYLAGSQPGMISSCEIDKSGVGTLTYIVNWEEFKNEILFAHKAYTDLGIKPSLTNAVIGLKLDGKPLTVNLIEPDIMLTSIIAGSGSGKGVMTMGLLASLYGAGASVIYLDNKPDISGMLWDLEREYSNKGLRLLAVDVGKEKHETTGATPIRTGNLNLLEQDERKYSEFKMLKKGKLFQLVTLIGKYKSDIENIIQKDISNLFFIIDELTSINTDFTNFQLYIEKRETEFRNKASKAKATQEEKDMAEYYSRLRDIIEGMNVDFVQGVTKDWRMSGLKIILIGQQIGSNWKVDGKGLATSFAGRLLAGTHRTISGAKQSNSNNFAFTEAQETLAKQRGVFSITDSTPSPISSDASKATGLPLNKAEIFQQYRSYFTLVKNDFDYDLYKQLLEEHSSVKVALEKYVELKGGLGFVTQIFGGLLHNDEAFLEGLVREVYDFEKHKNKEEVSFSGLLKVMQETSGISEDALIGNMNKGYDIMDSLFRSLPISHNYKHLEEYLCDCSPESVFTLNELKGMLGLEGAVYSPKARKEDTEDNEDTEEEIDIFGDTDRVDYEEEVSSKRNYSKETSRPNNNQGYSGVVGNSTNQPNNKTKVNQKTITNYQDELKIGKEENPFVRYQGEGVISTVNTVNEMTRIIMRDLQRIAGNYDMIKQFVVTERGQLIFNNVLYTPKLDEETMATIPLIMRENIKNGELVEFFNLREIYKFKNIEEIVIESHSLAQGRARKELGIGYRKRFSVLFKKFKHLQYLEVGETPYTRSTPETPGEEEYMFSGGGLFSRIFGPREPKEKLEKKVGNRNKYVDNFLNSRPVKITVGALGWTLGTQVVYGAAMLMGPWGLVFGALAMAGAYNEVKKANPSKGNKSNPMDFVNMGKTDKSKNKKKTKK